LEGVRERVKARCRMREQVVADLLADRLDFFSAAARFQQLDGVSPSVARVVELSYPGASPGENACRHLLAWIEADRSQDAEGAARMKLFKRCSAELEYYLRIHGKVVLPAVPRPSDLVSGT